MGNTGVNDVNLADAGFERLEGVFPDAERNGQPYEIEWADLDGDGDLDAVHMSWGGGRTERYKNIVVENLFAQQGELAFRPRPDVWQGRNLEDENEFEEGEEVDLDEPDELEDEMEHEDEMEEEMEEETASEEDV